MNSNYQTPEGKAREHIDKMLNDEGWNVVSRSAIEVDKPMAVKEAILSENKRADYFLLLGGKVVGLLEAKRAERNVRDNAVAEQAEGYARGVPNFYQSDYKTIPLVYLSNGEELYFKDMRKGSSSYQKIQRIHSPSEIVEMLAFKDIFAALPPIDEYTKKGLRACQIEAIENLEASFRQGKRRALMVLATGAGKTFIACLAAYRLLRYVPKIKRILFLVDRNNLGRQAKNSFGDFSITENGDPFDKNYSVERILSAKKPSSTVVIATIQRLFSLLKGETIEDVDDDGGFDPLEEMKVPENATLPPDFFDLIIIDECHRSIYGNWRKVLEYFSSARLIGLTATPIPETLAFFDKNIVVNYTLEQSIKDRINVGCRVYRIKTEATENGGAILEGDKYRRVVRYNGEVQQVNNTESRLYTREELNRSVVNPAQIKLVLETYRDAVYTELFTDPQRKDDINYLPKTLIFALNEAHATNIVAIAKEVFGRKDDTFVQKITHTVGDTDGLIKSFRNDKDFRIAVTCTLVATGTDVPALEVVLFMRDVGSETLYTQMKGRGVRAINNQTLQDVTPNAIEKNCFFLVDAVGVTEHEKVINPSVIQFNNYITLARLLELITLGNLQDDYLMMLSNRLFGLDKRCTPEQREEFTHCAKMSMKELATQIKQALESGELPIYVDINGDNDLRKELVRPLTTNAKARELLLIYNAGYVDTLQPGRDTLISKGFSIEEATATTAAFEAYCEQHKDEIEALRIIYNNRGEALTYEMLTDLIFTLKSVDTKFTINTLWANYSVLHPKKVVKFADDSNEREAITNIIQLVRFALKQTETLKSLYPEAMQRFNLWCGQKQRDITPEQQEVIAQVVDYIAANGFCDTQDIIQNNRPQAARLISAYGNIENTNIALQSLAEFIIYRKAA
ncbi:DEAD/DEAH box helicase family protein [Capnocytophaga gingivalis]|uniref:DEAD/DEAH box helicase family protein n=1 Tax=Capnocytophaga gingivalis TaxID=1017 RepID=UPI003C700CB3